MMTRNLNLVVEERVPGQFRWLIYEIKGRWISRVKQLLAQSLVPFESYQRAQDEGNLVLARMLPEPVPPAPSGFGAQWDLRTVQGDLRQHA